MAVIDYGALGQQAAANQQAMQIQQWQFQQARQQAAQQAAAQQAAGNSLPQLLAPPPTVAQQAGVPPAQPQQTPAPGQPSRPMIQPPPQGAAQPGQMPASPFPPGGAPQGAMPPQGVPPLPPGQPNGYRPMPTSPPPQAQQAPGSLPPPPIAAQPQAQPADQGGFNLQSVVAAGQKQGLTGTDLFEYVKLFEPYMTAQQKAQAEGIKTQIELKKLDAEINFHEAAARNQQATSSERNRHDEALERLADRRNDIMQQSANTRATTAQGGGDDAKLSADDMSFMAKQYLAGDKSVLQNLGRGVQGSRNLIALRKSIRSEAEDAGMQPSEVAARMAEFEGVKSGERTLGTRTANAGMAVNEANQFATNALAASEKVDRTQYPSLNKAIQAAERGSGGTDVVELATYTNSLINAYARAVSPTGSPTVSDKEHAREILDTAYSKGQFAAAINAMKKEMAAAQASPGQVRSEFRSAVTGDMPALGKGGAIPQGWTVKEH